MAEKKGARRAGRPKNPVSREHLLAKAREAFAELGFAGASMGEIADRAGLRKSSLFHHFSSKEALYQEVFGGIIQDLGQLVTGARLESGEPFLERLDRLNGMVTAYFGANPESGHLLLREFVDRGPFFKAAGREGSRLVLEAAVAFVAEGMEAGVIDRQDPKHLVMSVTGLHLNYFANAEISGDILGEDIFTPARLQERSEAVRDQVRRLCGAPAAG